MAQTDKVFAELFNQSDSVLICDVRGKVLYYQDYNDQINMIRDEEAVGRSIYELYPFFKRDDFTTFRAIDQKKPILNELQLFEVNGVPRKSLNSSYPLINETGVLGCMTLSVELTDNSHRQKKMRLLSKYNFEDIITQNRKFKESFETLKRIAATDASVLIYGETGTGKEVFASAIHEFSNKSKHNFVKINCAAIPNELLESELFGYEQGAFSGALSTGKVGKFEYAQNGTLLLDEIGDMPFHLQAKLLRAIQEKEFEKVGGLKTIPFNARIICTTNQNIHELIKQQKFRQDLYYRINVIELYIPPLRERKEDIRPLCRYFIDKTNRENGLSIVDISPKALDLLIQYDWPGNVRELRHNVERACFIRGAGMLEYEHFRQIKERMSQNNVQEVETALNGPEILTLEQVRAHAEIEEIKKALLLSKGNKSQAAKLLGVDRTILYDKMKKYEIQ